MLNDLLSRLFPNDCLFCPGAGQIDFLTHTGLWFIFLGFKHDEKWLNN